MCPALMTVASFAVSAGQAVMQFGAAQSDYEAKSAAWRQNYVNALAAGRDEQRQLTLRQMQEDDSYAQKTHLSLVDQAQKEAETQVSAAASGVAGVSLDNLVADVGRRAASNRLTYYKNWQDTAEQIQSEQDATVTREENRINSMPVPQSPNPASLAFNIAGAGLHAYGDYQRLSM